MNDEIAPVTANLSRRGLVKYKTNPFMPDAAANTNEGTKRRTLRSKDGSQLMVTSQSGEQIAPAGFGTPKKSIRPNL